MGGQQRGELRSPCHKLFQEQRRHVQLLSVGRVLQQFHGLGVVCCFFFRVVAEAEVIVSRFIGEQHAVVEGELASQVVSQNNVRQFVREHHRQAGFVGKH